MMHERDIPGFFTDLSRINKEEYLLFDYVFETPSNPRMAAAQIACESSTAQWKRQGSDEDLRIKFGAKVTSLSALRENTRYTVTIAHPIANFGANIPVLLSTLAGEGPFYCSGISTIRLQDIQFPDSFLAKFPGPQFGIEGLRRLTGIQDRPLFVGVVKPNLGLKPDVFAVLAYEAWMGGLDIAKDDEMLVSPEWSPLPERVRKACDLRRRAETETGQKKMFLANITAEPDQVREFYGQARISGATMVMINSFFTGLASIQSLRSYSQLPIMSHFAGQALWDRPPHFGIDAVVTVKLKRLMGADAIGLPGFGERMHASEAEVLAQIRACVEPMGQVKPCLPIPGGSDWAGSLPQVYAKVGHADFGFISGRGVFNHPQGPRAGALSLHQAWGAMEKKQSLEDYATTHPELAVALRIFG